MKKENQKKKSINANIGTPEYMAYELINGTDAPVTKMVDYWALGCLVYELFIGC